MSYVCDKCSKGAMRCTKGKHRPGKSSKKFRYRAHKVIRVLKPNLHTTKVFDENGNSSKLLLCTKCMKQVAIDTAKANG